VSDVGMLEARENLALMAKARQHFRTVHAALDHPDGHLLALLFVVALTQVY
jgi:hypothetical protein